MNNQNKYKSIIDLIEMSTAHGYSNIVRSKRKFPKYIWILFTTLSTIGCFWFVIVGVFEYLSYNVFTNIQFVFEQPSQFPTITFCSFEGILKKNNLSDLITTCYFAYDNGCETDPYNHFEKFYSGNYGNCYKLNSGVNFYGKNIKIRNSILGGRDDSFRLTLKAPSGLVLWIHNHTY